jgi:hypothetical protein
MSCCFMDDLGQNMLCGIGSGKVVWFFYFNKKKLQRILLQFASSFASFVRIFLLATPNSESEGQGWRTIWDSGKTSPSYLRQFDLFSPPISFLLRKLLPYGVLVPFHKFPLEFKVWSDAFLTWAWRVSSTIQVLGKKMLNAALLHKNKLPQSWLPLCLDN